MTETQEAPPHDGPPPDAKSDFMAAALEARQRWLDIARPLQVTPGGQWDTWLLLAGRGSGKTRAGAEDAFWHAARAPRQRIGCIGSTHADMQKVMFEGESGLLAIMDDRASYLIESYNKSDAELILKNGSMLIGKSAEKPDRLRGPQWHRLWCFPAGTPVTMADGTHKPIETMRPGDVVDTAHGPRRVTGAMMTNPDAELMTITAIDGHQLTATASHNVWIDELGWRPVDQIQPGDILWTRRRMNWVTRAIVRLLLWHSAGAG